MLRKHVLGNKTIDFEFLSDQNQNFPDSFGSSVNYEDMNLNVAIPVFSIHGNHDDITGTGRLSSMDILSSTGLINYFGKWRDLSQVDITPIVLQKNSQKLAIYGLSHIHDARLARLFRDEKVNVRKPEIPDDDIFNLMVLHQNRADRGRFNYLPEDELPIFMDLVLWGHEHDCRIEPEPNPRTQTFITQPGSSVATSLSEGESIEKKIGMLNVRGKQFKLDPVTLKTVRPFVFRSVNLDDYNDEMRFSEGDTRGKLEKFFYNITEEMIEESKKKITGNKKQPTIPLIRLRILYSDERLVINTARFGQKFDKVVANPESLLAFKKNFKKIRKIGYNPDENALKAAFIKKEQQDTVEDVVESYFNELEDDKEKLELFHLKSLTEYCRLLVKDDDTAAYHILEKHYDEGVKFLNEKVLQEDDIDEALEQFQLQKSKDVFNLALVENSRNKSTITADRVEPVGSDGEDDADDSMTGVVQPAKRGRGRASASTSTATSARGKAKKAAAVDKSTSSAGTASDTKKGRGRATQKQPTIAEQLAAKKKKQATVYIDSEDSD